MDSFLAIISRSKRGKMEGKLSLSCGDLESAGRSQHHDERWYRTVGRHKDTKDLESSLNSSWPGRLFLKKSTGSAATGSMDRAKSKSTNELVNEFDSQLAEIRERLAKFRKQDMEFHERMDSLNHSISELTSLNSFTPSEASATSDLILFSDDEDNSEQLEEKNGKDLDDKTSENHSEKICLDSFSSKVVNSIPAIKVTSCKRSNKLLERRRSSDPALHETSARLLKSSTTSERHSICSPDHNYWYDEKISTLL